MMEMTLAKKASRGHGTSRWPFAPAEPDVRAAVVSADCSHANIDML